MIGTLVSLGLDLFKDKAEDVVFAGIKKATGIDLTGVNPAELSEAQINKIKAAEANIAKEMELIYADKDSARRMAVELGKSDSWLLKNSGSMIGLFVVIMSMSLFGLLLSGQLTIANSNVAMIVGFAGGYITQVLSFYFGSSKNKQ